MTSENYLLFLWYCGLNSGPSPWATPLALFCEGFFQDRVSWTSCLGWLWTAILLFSASLVASITGENCLLGNYYSLSMAWWCSCNSSSQEETGRTWVQRKLGLPRETLFQTPPKRLLKTPCMNFGTLFLSRNWSKLQILWL
jgi:hypothetical protein